jgi:choline dehydrogenase-like flavoprotein
MLIDAREIPRDTVLEADLCVIGAGAAGITLARELQGTATKVILLESGGFDTDEATQALADGEVVGAPLYRYWDTEALVGTRLRLFGGTTNHWAGFCRPLEQVDFTARPAVGSPGWPFGLDELLPWYARATEVCALHNDHFDYAWWAENLDAESALVDDETVATTVFQVNYPYSFGSTFRQDLVAAPNVDVCLWANVVDLPLTPGTDQLDRVEIATLEGNQFAVRARAYVLATGGIENARLLLAATGDRPAGLGNENDLVGRYFTEHLQVLAGFALLDRPSASLEFYSGIPAPAPTPTNPDPTITARAILNPTSTTVETNELLGLEAQLLVAGLDAGPTYAGGVEASDVDRLLAAIEASEGGPGDQSIAYLQVVAEQQANPDSRVLLGDERDALGLPVVALDWRHTDLDRQSIVRGLEIIGTELGRQGVGRLQIAPGDVLENPDAVAADPLSLYRVLPDGAEFGEFPIGIGYHHLCTTRMSADPSAGVVDPDGRLHSVTNLWVAGSSTFATGGTATPTYTIVALALRLADHLQRTALA